MTVKNGSKSSGNSISKMSRRKFMGTAAGVAAAGSITGFPNIVQAAAALR